MPESFTPSIVSAISDLAASRVQDVAAGECLVRMEEVYALVTDPRDPRGRRHSLASILMLVQAALVTGATTWAAIRHWISAAPQHALAECGVRVDPRTGRYRPPHPETITKVLAAVKPAELDLAYAQHRATQMARLHDGSADGGSGLFGIAVDGKTSRGTAHHDVRALHRMGAFLHEDAVMVAALDVDGKSNEIGAFTCLLDQIDDLTGAVVTGDAMHCQRGHARYLHRRGAHYVFPVALNQPGLFDQLNTLPWAKIPVSSDAGWMTYDRGHGRQEIRTIQTMPAPAGLRFPHAAQVFLIERHIYNLTGTHLSSIAVLGVTDLTPAQAGPARLLAFNRGQWAIENRDHHVRDTTLGEDHCKVTTKAKASILATMRSYAISTLRLLGFTNIAEATRWARDDFTRPITALRLTM